MREFFHGWRWKVGVAMLVLACVFAAGWVRSLSTIDEIAMPIGRMTELIFVSLNGRVWIDWGGRYPHLPQKPLWDSVRLSDTAKAATMAGGADELEHALRASLVPYWSIVIPLTLLSAYLLLSKPRVANRQNQRSHATKPM
jgi:hypothetical protein